MQRIKKPFLWLMLLSLMISLFPVGLLTPKASAADENQGPTHFIPFIQELKKTFTLVMEAEVTGKEQITRSNVYHVTTPTIDIEGSYKSGLSSTGMTVLVERLVQTTNKSNSELDWVPDKTNVYSNVITPTTGNTFKAANVTLFEGFNRVTFSGILGGTTKSESFYILYDKVPYLEELVMFDGGSLGTPLNEGTPVITTEAVVQLEGKAQNANTISISVNGEEPTTVPRDEYSGKFYVSGVKLSEGTNEVQIVIKNGADTVTMNRTIFRVSDTQKVSALYLYSGVDKTKTYDVYNKVPVITQTMSNVHFIAQVIIPYDHHVDGDLANLKNLLKAEFRESGVTTGTPITIDKILKMKAINTDGTVDATEAEESSKEVVVPDANGNSRYFIVTFSASAYTPEDNKLNQLSLAIEYGTSFKTTIPVSFRYSPGRTTITNLYYLPSFQEPTAGPEKSIDEFTKMNLNGASVNTGTFYVLIETNEPIPVTSKLDATYLPRGSKNLEIDRVLNGNIALEQNQYLYKISNFSAGQQQLSFQFTNGEEARATVSYITMTKIAYTNLVYGQTYSVDSKSLGLSMKIEGEYLGFENFKPADNASSSINGVYLSQTTGVEKNKVKFSGNKFTLDAEIGSNGPLYFGENRIVFYGTTRDGNGNARTVTGELLIYIMDINGSTISGFQPEAKSTVLLPNKNLMEQLNADNPDTQLAAQKEYDQIIQNLFVPSPTFTYDPSADNYTTNNKSVNLIARGTGATRVKVNFGSTNLINEALVDAVGSNTNDSFTFDFGSGTKTYKYYLVGSEKEFVLRVEGLDIEVPGTYTFNLELINDSGSRTSKKLEIVRVVEPFRLLAPQPNLDGQYIVNKNFVRIDIEAEGATKVLIDKYEATPRKEPGMQDRFIYDYVGLKPDKTTSIKVQIVRADTTLNSTIDVYYASAVNVDSQYMAEKVAAKYSAFNKQIELSFPKGTILQTAFPGTSAIEYYPDNKLLFGIADPENGVVGKRDDYGNYIGGRFDNSESGYEQITIPAELKNKFSSPESRINFTSISNVYWIHGGLGGSGDNASTNGLQPYSLDGKFTTFPVDRKIVPSQRGELTLAYNSNVVDDAGTTITVFRYTDSGIWENIGGEVDTKSHTITVPFDDFGYYTVMKLRRGYDDVTNHNWARNILNALYSKGIMKNLRGDSFGTDDRITRGEFATLLVKGLNIPLNYPTDGNHSKSTFTDVGPGAATETWSYKYIETAARAGIVTGTKEGEFAPYTPITREQAAVMISRALKLKLSLNDEKLNSALAKSFTDSGSMDYYARPAIQAVSKAKIMNGTASTLPGQKKASYSFNPKGYMTRAEAGKIAVELFKKSTSIFPKTFN